MEPIDKRTIDKIRGYETSYQEGAWEDFEKFRKKRKKRPLIIFWRMAAGIAISLVIGWGIYKINNSDTDLISVKKEQRPADGSGRVKSETGNNTFKDGKFIAQKPTNIKRLIVKKSVHPQSIDKKTLPEPKNINSNPIPFTEEKNFQPDLLQSHNFSGVLVRPKIPFMPPYPVNEKEEIKEKKNNLLKFSIALAGLSHQAANTIPQQNFGFRGTTEIALSRKAELSTGIYIGRENLMLLNTTTPLSSPLGMPQLNQANYRWLNIEVPLNVRYRVWQKGSLAFSTQTGISIMGAFNQTSQLFYENHRTVVLVSVGENGQIQEVTTTFVDKEVKNNISNAQRISLGTALNFSLGIHYPLGKNQLSVEPFFKYPVGAFTAEKLHYSSMGVQLRWSISGKGREK